MNENPACPRCQASVVIKNGKVQGKQRYKCKKCRMQFTRLTPRGHPAMEKATAIMLYTLGLSMFCTDKFEVYKKEISVAKLRQSKAETVAIERNNGRQRHWFARFRRKSIVVSKSLQMVDLTMALFARFHVNGNWQDIPTLVT